MGSVVSPMWVGFISTFNTFPVATKLNAFSILTNKNTICKLHPVSLSMMESSRKQYSTLRSKKGTSPRASHKINEKVFEAQKLRKEKKWKEAKSVLDSIQTVANDDINFLNEMIHVHAAKTRETNPTISSSELLKELMTLVNSSVVQLTVTTFNAVLLAIRERVAHPQNQSAKQRMEDLRSASTVFDLLLKKKLIPDAFTMSILYQMCASYRSVNHAQYFERHVQQLSGFSHNSISGSALIAAFAKCGKPHLAESTLKSLIKQDVAVNERSYVSVISAFHRTGRHAKVLEYFYMAIDSPYVTPNIYLFSGTLASCCRTKDSLSARSIFELMLTKNVKPNEDILVTLFETCLGSGDIQLSEKLLFEWMPKSGIMEPHIGRVNKLISCLKAKGTGKEDIRISIERIIYRMEHVLNLKPDLITYNSFVTTLIKNDRHDDAYEYLLNDFEKSGFAKDVITYNLLIQCCGKKKMVDEAYDVFKGMKSKNIPASDATYNILLDIFAESGRIELNEILFKELEKDPNVGLNSISIPTQLKMCRKEKRWRNGMEIARKWEKRGFELDAKTYSMLLTILFENRRVTESITLFGWLLWKRRIDCNMFNVMIDQIGRRPHQFERCMRFFKKMKEVGVVPDEITYTSLIRVCAKNGQLACGFRLLGEMQDVGLGTRDSYAWTVLIDGSGRIGQWERGLELLDTMRERGGESPLIPYPTTASYNAALYGAGTKGGGWKIALKIYKWLEMDTKVEPDMITYSSMSSIILRNRSQIEDWQVVRDIYEELCVCVRMCEKENNKGNSRNRMTTVTNKLIAKKRRLEWLLKQHSN